MKLGSASNSSKVATLIPLGIAAVAVVGGLGCGNGGAVEPPSDQPTDQSGQVETR